MTYDDNVTKQPQPQDSVKEALDVAKLTVDSVSRDLSDQVKLAGSKIASGTEMLSEEARERVVVARRTAMAAGQSTKQAVRRGQRSAGDFFENQPLVVGALAVALGAAIGGLMPRSRFENDHVGSHRDKLVAEADRIFEDEKRKLGAVAKATVGEAKAILSAKKDAIDEVTGDQTLASAVLDEAKRVGGKIADRAVDAAQQQNLGKPKV